MATSETTAFESTFYIDDIIEEAFDRVGLANVTGYQMKSARRSLNIMFQEWGNRGLHYWEIGSTNINLVEGQAEYKFFRSTDDGTSAVTTDPASVYGLDDVLEATFRTNKGATNQTDSALTKIGRSTYSGLSAKLNTGSPSQYYVQRFSTYNSIFLYPTPNASAAGNEVFFFFVKRIQDAGTFGNNADVPYRFVPCMVSGLAFYLAQKYAPQAAEQLKMYYEDELNRALTEDGSSSSTYLTPQSYYPNV